jgi:hypothetical protein
VGVTVAMKVLAKGKKERMEKKKSASHLKFQREINKS